MTTGECLVHNRLAEVDGQGVKLLANCVVDGMVMPVALAKRNKKKDSISKRFCQKWGRQGKSEQCLKPRQLGWAFDGDVTIQWGIV